ncbi:MAG: hypothetical protein ACYCO5_01640 [Acidobacteriaceae bacterium]
MKRHVLAQRDHLIRNIQRGQHGDPERIDGGAALGRGAQYRRSDCKPPRNNSANCWRSRAESST